jgi:hypothetical protein
MCQRCDNDFDKLIVIKPNVINVNLQKEVKICKIIHGGMIPKGP